MPRMCEMCAKTAQKAANRSHANNKTLRRQNVNLQKVAGMRICTRCIKTIARATA